MTSAQTLAAPWGRPVVLIICDGWGVGASEPEEARRQGNAVALARTPVMDRLTDIFPHCLLTASGEAVGLPAGQMGNSEVGHLNLGAGRTVPQMIVRISASIRDGSFFTHSELMSLAERLRTTGGNLHLIGMCSEGGVHSHIDHLFALVKWAERANVSTYIHCITDGRDSPPTAGLAQIERLEHYLEKTGSTKTRIASVTGRYFAMDRDRRWARTEQAYRAIAEGDGRRTERASDYIASCYTDGETDEFLPAAVVTGAPGTPDTSKVAAVQPQDALLSFNFRADRVRQIVSALADTDFTHFPRKEQPRPYLLAMTRYTDDFPHPVLFPPQHLDNVLGAVLSQNGKTQLRIAETEKYAHVTYFFNGGKEDPDPGEDRHLIPSPKVSTYDLQPQMNAPELTNQLLNHLDSQLHDFILVNYANPDMVGHTGNIPATVKAVETVDACVGSVLTRLHKLGGTALVTADHGNAEWMLDDAGGPHTAHTTSPVSLVWTGGDSARPDIPLRDGILADVAPTVLGLMGVAIPPEMTGTSLITDPCDGTGK